MGVVARRGQDRELPAHNVYCCVGKEYAQAEGRAGILREVMPPLLLLRKRIHL
jgi:hypothetical protein